MRVIDFFDRGVNLDAEAPCLSDLGAPPASHREVARASHAIAAGLLELGITPETKIAIYSPNVAAAFTCMLGVMRSCAVWVPINSRNATAENGYVLDNTDVEVLLIHSSYFHALETLKFACPKIRHIVGIDKPATPSGLSVMHWLDRHREGQVERPSSPDAISAIFSSGGTTGKPKGVTWSNRTWATMIANFNANMVCDTKPVHLIVAPMTHGAGAVAMCLAPAGTHQIVMEAFDAEKVLRAIQTCKVTHLFLPPTAIYMLLAHPRVRDFDYSSLRYFLYAAAPMSADKLRQALDIFGPVMAQSYGQAESPLIATFLSPQEHVHALAQAPQRLLSCGRPSLLSPVEIIDDEGAVSGRGERGEIAVRGDLVMMGYYKNEEATAETRAGEWHRTGDIGYRDEDGFVYIVDRKRDMIISGGFNVYPSEVEQVIWSHPAVQDCAVVGAPDDKWGEAVTAVIELRAGQQVTADEIIAMCRERLGPVKAPKCVQFRDSLPRSVVGKVLKRDLRAEFWQGRERALSL